MKEDNRYNKVSDDEFVVSVPKGLITWCTLAHLDCCYRVFRRLNIVPTPLALAGLQQANMLVSTCCTGLFGCFGSVWHAWSDGGGTDWMETWDQGTGY